MIKEMDSILRCVNDTSMCHFSCQKPLPESYRDRLCRNDKSSYRSIILVIDNLDRREPGQAGCFIQLY